ncbi:MAG: HAD family hydrolase [Oscillospiraceae bacterium]|nr:HAD family hydrolase [Oscillospiraceae bacterium]
MNYKAIFFDLDGTLLPMDNDTFTKGYFRELAKKLSPVGIEPKPLIDAVWAGTKSMVTNDGSGLNADIFWDTFASVTGLDYLPFRNAADEFYKNEFSAAKQFTGENPLAKKAVDMAHQCSRKVICAANPLFPLDGQLMRLGWVGLGKKDFDYICSYETESFCKPNPKFYTSLCEKTGVKPHECLMIGNDENEDMYAALMAGMNAYLVTDNAVMCEKHRFDGDAGSFEEMTRMLSRD